MRIDENGNAQGNYTLLALQEVSPVNDPNNPDYYPLNRALAVSADFVHDSPGNLPLLRFTREIEWPLGVAPRDEPVCGFYGDLCKKGQSSSK